MDEADARCQSQCRDGPAPPLPAYLVVDHNVLEADLVAMAARVTMVLHSTPRPTKCLDIAHRHVALGAVGLTWQPWVRRRFSPALALRQHDGGRLHRRLTAHSPRPLGGG